MSDIPSKRRKTSFAPRNLRAIAESELAEHPVAESANPATIENILHELQVHQIELEMQNEELRHAHIALEESRDRYLDLFEFAPIGYFTLTSAGLIAEVNFVGAELLGVDRKKMLLRPFSRYIAPDFSDQFHLHLSRLIRDEDQQQNYDIQIKRENGALHYVHVDALRVVADDHVVTLRITLTDISENKRMEEALRTTTDYLDSLIEHASGPIVVWDSSGKITKVNQSISKLTGFKARELVGQSIDMLFTAANRGEIMEGIQTSMKGQSWNSLELPIQHKSGSIRIISWNSATLFFADGKTIRAVIAQGQDITDRKKNEENMRIAAIAFEAQEGMMVTDKHCIIIRINKAFTRLTGYRAEEAVGKSVIILRSGRHDAAFYQHLWKAIDRDHYWQGEIWDKRKNGEIFPALMTITAVIDSNGSTTHYVCSFLDITLQKQAENVLLDARKRLEKQVENAAAELNFVKEESEETNTALKVMIKMRRTENFDAKNLLTLELKQEVLPFLLKLKIGNKDAKQTRLIDALEANLQRLISCYGSPTSITSAYKSLTPKEIQVATMVREGFSTKVIASTLSLSPETVSIHRKNIRKKLGLESKAENLRSYLISYDK